MRIWSRNILPYLPKLQFLGQLRELVAIMRDWRDKGETNHLLINKVMEYPKVDLALYYSTYDLIFKNRFGVYPNEKYAKEFAQFADESKPTYYQDWLETKDHLRVEMANLYEKHFHAKGKSQITDVEWQTLLDGYKKITGEDYKI